MKKILVAILLTTAVVFTGCSTHEDTATVIQQAKEEVQEKNYDKADVSLSSILGQDDSEGTANKLHSAIQNYDKAKDALDSGKLQQASDALDKIDMNFIESGMKEDVNKVKNKVESANEIASKVNKILDDTNEFIDNNKLDQYKQDLIKKVINSLENGALEENINGISNILENIKEDISVGKATAKEVQEDIKNKIDNLKAEVGTDIKNKVANIENVIDGIKDKVDSDVKGKITGIIDTVEEVKNKVASGFTKRATDIDNMIADVKSKIDDVLNKQVVQNGSSEARKNTIVDTLSKVQTDINNVISQNAKAPNSSYASSDISNNANYGNVEEKKKTALDVLDKEKKALDDFINGLNK